MPKKWGYFKFVIPGKGVIKIPAPVDVIKNMRRNAVDKVIYSTKRNIAKIKPKR